MLFMCAINLVQNLAIYYAYVFSLTILWDEYFFDRSNAKKNILNFAYWNIKDSKVLL